MAQASPIVAGWELVLRLRERREQVNVEIKDITKELGFSRNYWSAIENERKILSEDALKKLLILLEADKDETSEMLRLRNIAKDNGWWTNYTALFDTELRRFFGLEHGAHSIRGYENLLVPGLLQTRDYARAVIHPTVTVPRVQVEQRVEVRLRRQARLDDPEPLGLTTIISEAVLHQQIGGPAVLRGQLEHLVKMIDKYQNNLQVHVVPFTATACSLFGAATVHLIDFENPRLPTVVWQETVTAWGVIDDFTQVNAISAAYDQALQQSLNVEDSKKLIQRCIKELP
ncbi:MAG: Scr1 family TA system antitoxin-like transcriptional regulator [Actinophytocola sp.]|uniref:Scr1 family TA system antitoxin-like transcriptional regulator n=1 Tax=Actinophytocola sp. TaxID=1872138 RepID=UPI003D6A45EA